MRSCWRTSRTSIMTGTVASTGRAVFLPRGVPRVTTGRRNSVFIVAIPGMSPNGPSSEFPLQCVTEPVVYKAGPNSIYGIVG